MKISRLATETSSLLRHLAEYQAMVEGKLAADKEGKAQALLDSEEQETALLEIEMEVHSWLYDSYFSRFMRYSLIVTLVVVLESQLTAICTELGKMRKIPLRAKDLKGDTIGQSKRYLADVLNLHLDFQLWERIADLVKVRNCIVHALGNVELSNDRNRLLDLVKLDSGLSLGETVFSEVDAKDILYLSSEFCSQSIKIVEQFFDVLLDEAGYPKGFSQ